MENRYFCILGLCRQKVYDEEMFIGTDGIYRCGMQYADTGGEAEKAARKAALVEKALADRHYTIDVQMMYPQQGPARNVSGDYSLEVRGDTLISSLPYFGRAYLVPYGGGKGLNFSEADQ